MRRRNRFMVGVIVVAAFVLGVVINLAIRDDKRHAARQVTITERCQGIERTAWLDPAWKQQPQAACQSLMADAFAAGIDDATPCTFAEVPAMCGQGKGKMAGNLAIYLQGRTVIIGQDKMEIVGPHIRMY